MSCPFAACFFIDLVQNRSVPPLVILPFTSSRAKTLCRSLLLQEPLSTDGSFFVSSSHFSPFEITVAPYFLLLAIALPSYFVVPRQRLVKPLPVLLPFSSQFTESYLLHSSDEPSQFFPSSLTARYGFPSSFPLMRR